METKFLQISTTSKPYLWLFEIGNKLLGVEHLNGWCMSLGERIIYFNTEKKCNSLLPILEIDYEKLQLHLNNTIEKIPSYASDISTFPKILLLKHAFHDSVSDYWPGKALAWLDADPAISIYFETELTTFLQDKSMPQTARQQANKILKSFRKMRERNI